MRLRKAVRDQRGFTLVELLVVVTIIAILAAVLVPRLIDYTNKARESRALSELAAIKSAIEIYTMDEGKGTLPSKTSGDSNFINTVLNGKVNIKEGANPWGTGYYYNTYGTSYIVFCKSQVGSSTTYYYASDKTEPVKADAAPTDGGGTFNAVQINTST